MACPGREADGKSLNLKTSIVLSLNRAALWLRYPCTDDKARLIGIANEWRLDALVALGKTSLHQT